jgi:hypothetical protein
VYARLQKGSYKPTWPFPYFVVTPGQPEAVKKKQDSWSLEARKLREKFKKDIFQEYGLSEHPKRELLWKLANRYPYYELEEIYWEFDALAVLLQ